MTLAADAIEAIQDAIRGGGRVLPVAGATKAPLCRPPADDIMALDVSGLRGIVEYDPAELTLTALAATPIAEVTEALAEHGQYLPFDPLLSAAGATLGGTVAAAASGPGALRHGGVRDFVIGVRFVDGAGDLVGGGGKVVKNAAGFDLPKLMVGSMGRLGVIVQLSFKVFPRPSATVTLDFGLSGRDEELAAMARLVRGPAQLDALELTGEEHMLVRLGGESQTLGARAERVGALVGASPRVYEGEEEAALWSNASELSWVDADSLLVRIPLTRNEVPALDAALSGSGAAVRYGMAANVAWISWPCRRDLDDLDALLHRCRLSGSVLAGEPAHGRRVVLGPTAGGAFAERIQRVLDPHRRFPEA